jgi:signal transduction histidine kinase/ligand-binding sensor domain-containing protein
MRSAPSSGYPEPAPAHRSFRAHIIGLLAAILWLGACLAVRAELPGRYRIRGWQVEHGLPQNHITAIAQTPDGFLWLGTPNGLVRFDGLHFEIFDGTKVPELRSAHVRSLFVNSGGRLWIGTEEGGVVRLEAGQFKEFKLPADQPANALVAFAEEASGTLWLMSGDGTINRISQGNISPGPVQWRSEGTAPYKLFQTPDKQAWASNRLNLYQLQDKNPVPVLEGTFAQYQFLTPSRNGGWWIAMGGRVRLWRNEQWIEERGAPAWDRHNALCCLEDRQGRLWIGSAGQGLFRYDADGDVEQFSTREGLASDGIQALCEDGEGNIWVGTNGGGLNRLHRGLFQVYGQEHGLASSSVSCVAQRGEGEVWIGSADSGLSRIKDGQIRCFGRKEGLESLQIRSLLSDTKGELWVGTASGKCFRRQGAGFVPLPDSDIGTGPIQCLFEDRQKRIWLGHRNSNGIGKLAGDRIIPFPLPENPGAVSITCMAEDSAGFLLVGTESHGLFSMGPGLGRRWTSREGLPGEPIRCLLPQPDGSVWIGTAGAGLVRLKAGQFVTCGKREGLPDLFIEHIQDDTRGYLWMSSNQGVFRVNQKQINEFAEGLQSHVSCLTFGISDGLPALRNSSSPQSPGARTRDGRLWFPTQKGLAVLDPAQLEQGQLPPPVFLQETRIDGEVRNRNQAGRRHQGPLRVPPGNHRYEFRYTGIHFRTPERVRFRYRMEGLETEWVEARSERTAHYSSLPAGNYRFQVQAALRDGAWNPEGSTVALTVEPELWERPWILALGVISAAGSLAGLVRALTRRRWRIRLRELEFHQKVETERNRIAQDIHDDLGAGLTQIGWLGEMSSRLADEPEVVRQQSRKIVATAREMVTSLDEIVWAVRPQNDSLRSLVEYLGRRVDELFESSAIRVWFTAPTGLPELMVLADVRHHFFLICKEILHNALKHSGGTEVRIHLEFRKPSTLHISIEDNGTGFDPAKAQGAGNGLRNMRERAERVGASLSLCSTPGTGCRIEITIPLTSAGPIA